MQNVYYYLNQGLFYMCRLNSVLVVLIILFNYFAVQAQKDSVTLEFDDNTLVFRSDNNSQGVLEVCNPPCRSGYTCIDGECVSLCNPPCPPGSKCDPKISDCVPLNPSNYQYYNPSMNYCQPGYFHVGRKCLTKDEMASSGNVIFTITNVFFGMGTAYSAVVPFILNQTCRSDYGYWYSEYTAIGCTAPQTGMFVIAGGLNKTPLHMQAKCLRMLDVEPDQGLLGASWALWGASMGTATATIFINISENESSINAFATVNCLTLFASYIVSNIAYFSQKDKLVNALKKKNVVIEDGKKIQVHPYYSFANKTSKLGVQIGF